MKRGGKTIYRQVLRVSGKKKKQKKREEENIVSNCKEERNCDDCDDDMDIYEKYIIKLGLVLNAHPLQK